MSYSEEFARKVTIGLNFENLLPQVWLHWKLEIHTETLTDLMGQNYNTFNYLSMINIFSLSVLTAIFQVNLG